MRAFLRSMRYAYEGLQYVLGSQRNMKFHFFAAFVALLLALVLHLNKLDILFIMLAVTLVVVTEMINTAIEKAVDLASPELHPLAKIAKDVAAAAVLVTAGFAVCVGLLVFYDPFVRLLRSVKPAPIGGLQIGSVWVFLTLVAMVVAVFSVRLSAREHHPVRPSLLAALAFAAAALAALISRDGLVMLLALGLAAIILVILYDKTARSLAGLVLSALIGVAVTVLAYWLIHLA